MKLKQLVLALAVCLFINSATAQDLRKNGSSYGKIESNGDVRINGSIKGRGNNEFGHGLLPFKVSKEEQLTTKEVQQKKF